MSSKPIRETGPCAQYTGYSSIHSLEPAESHIVSQTKPPPGVQQSHLENDHFENDIERSKSYDYHYGPSVESIPEDFAVSAEHLPSLVDLEAPLRPVDKQKQLIWHSQYSAEFAENDREREASRELHDKATAEQLKSPRPVDDHFKEKIRKQQREAWQSFSNAAGAATGDQSRGVSANSLARAGLVPPRLPAPSAEVPSAPDPALAAPALPQPLRLPWKQQLEPDGGVGGVRGGRGAGTWNGSALLADPHPRLPEVHGSSASFTTRPGAGLKAALCGEQVPAVPQPMLGIHQSSSPKPKRRFPPSLVKSPGMSKRQRREEQHALLQKVAADEAVAEEEPTRGAGAGPTDHDGTCKDNALVLDSSSEDEAGPEPEHNNPDAGLRRSTRIRQPMHETLADKLKGLRAMFPNATDPDALEVTAEDLRRLEREEFLNDTVIDLWLKKLHDDLLRSRPDELRRFHFFNSFFYKKLCQRNKHTGDGARSSYESAQRWTKNVNIFSKEYLFVPIHDALHWSLVLVCFPGCRPPDKQPCILHLDSLRGSHDIRYIKPPLLSFMEAEWEAKRSGLVDDNGEPLRFDPKSFVCRTVPVPKQNNSSDCGLFLLKYVEQTIEWCPTRVSRSQLETACKQQNLGIVNPHTSLPFLGTRWFKAESANSLRHTIEEFIVKLFESQCFDSASATVQEAIRSYLDEREANRRRSAANKIDRPMHFAAAARALSVGDEIPVVAMCAHSEGAADQGRALQTHAYAHTHSCSSTQSAETWLESEGTAMADCPDPDTNDETGKPGEDRWSYEDDDQLESENEKVQAECSRGDVSSGEGEDEQEEEPSNVADDQSSDERNTSPETEHPRNASVVQAAREGTARLPWMQDEQSAERFGHVNDPSSASPLQSEDDENPHRRVNRVATGSCGRVVSSVQSDNQDNCNTEQEGLWRIPQQVDLTQEEPPHLDNSVDVCPSLKQQDKDAADEGYPWCSQDRDEPCSPVFSRRRRVPEQHHVAGAGLPPQNRCSGSNSASEQLPSSPVLDASPQSTATLQAATLACVLPDPVAAGTSTPFSNRTCSRSRACTDVTAGYATLDFTEQAQCSDSDHDCHGGQELCLEHATENVPHPSRPPSQSLLESQSPFCLDGSESVLERSDASIGLHDGELDDSMEIEPSSTLDATITKEANVGVDHNTDTEHSLNPNIRMTADVDDTLNSSGGCIDTDRVATQLQPSHLCCHLEQPNDLSTLGTTSRSKGQLVEDESFILPKEFTPDRRCTARVHSCGFPNGIAISENPETVADKYTSQGTHAENEIAGMMGSDMDTILEIFAKDDSGEKGVLSSYQTEGEHAINLSQEATQKKSEVYDRSSDIDTTDEVCSGGIKRPCVKEEEGMHASHGRGCKMLSNFRTHRITRSGRPYG